MIFLSVPICSILQCTYPTFMKSHLVLPKKGPNCIKLLHPAKYLNITNDAMKLHSLCNFKKRDESKELCKNKLNIKSTSTATDNQVHESKASLKSSKNKWSCVVPVLSTERISEITTVTGISIGVCHVSWAKISIPTVRVLDWNAKPLPDDFRCQKDEPSILKLAYEVKSSLPNSDLYVMETFSMGGRRMVERLNFIHLSSMLTVLLNGLVQDSTWKDKVVFQKQFVLNNLHNILIGGERTSTRHIVEDIMYKSLNADAERGNSEEKISDLYSSIDFKLKNFDFYKQLDLSKKEDLSIVLLLTLSFIDVIILCNERSLLKVQRRKLEKLK